MAWSWTLIQRECTGCGICADVCQSAAIEMTRPMAYPQPVSGRCAGCRKCVEECPFGAIVVNELVR